MFSFWSNVCVLTSKTLESASFLVPEITIFSDAQRSAFGFYNWLNSVPGENILLPTNKAAGSLEAVLYQERTSEWIESSCSDAHCTRPMHQKRGAVQMCTACLHQRAGGIARWQEIILQGLEELSESLVIVCPSMTVKPGLRHLPGVGRLGGLEPAEKSCKTSS